MDNFSAIEHILRVTEPLEGNDMDTTRKMVEQIKDIVLYVDGLYYTEDSGEKVTPDYLYFGIEYPDNGCVGGTCYTHIPQGLYPVCTPDGKQFRISRLRDVNAWYKDGKIYGFYKQ